MRRSIIFLILGATSTVMLITLLGRSILKTSINRRMDSSEAVMMNEIDGRLFRDFNSDITPTNIEVTPNSFQYSLGDRAVSLTNTGNKIDIKILYSDQTTWEGNLRGKIEVSKVDVVNIGNDIKVNLEDTNSEIYAITYIFVDNPQSNRITLNRNYTRYLSVIRD